MRAQAQPLSAIKIQKFPTRRPPLPPLPRLSAATPTLPAEGSTLPSAAAATPPATAESAATAAAATVGRASTAEAAVAAPAASPAAATAAPSETAADDTELLRVLELLLLAWLHSIPPPPASSRSAASSATSASAAASAANHDRAAPVHAAARVIHSVGWARGVFADGQSAGFFTELAVAAASAEGRAAAQAGEELPCGDACWPLVVLRLQRYCARALGGTSRTAEAAAPALAPAWTRKVAELWTKARLCDRRKRCRSDLTTTWLCAHPGHW